MSRLPARGYSELDDAGRAVWDQLGVPVGKVGLIGPFNAWAQVPAVGRPLLELGTTLLSATSLDRRLVELAIITTGAHWKAEFEWWAHATMAKKAGVTEAVIESIGRGQEPTLELDDERAVYAVARALATTGSVDAETYAAAQGLLGDTSVVELITVCGYYALVSYTLNALDVPLPKGVSPRWA